LYASAKPGIAPTHWPVMLPTMNVAWPEADPALAIAHRHGGLPVRHAVGERHRPERLTSLAVFPPTFQL
jgi:hypothetical protein